MNRQLIYALIALLVMGGMFALGWVAATSNLDITSIAQTEVVDPTPVVRAPTLNYPPVGAVFADVSPVWLEWGGRPLEADEVYDVQVGRANDVIYGVTWTTEKKLDLRGWLLEQEAGEFCWTVAILRYLDEDGNVEEIAPGREPHCFTVDAITLDIIDLPDGFTARMVANLPLTDPAVITFDSQQRLYALSLTGDIARLSDADGDGWFEAAELIYVDENEVFSHAVGMALSDDDAIYISSSGMISRMTDTDQDGYYETIETIVGGLPSLLHPFHSNNGIAFGEDGKLYIAVGSTSDHEVPTEPLESSILRVNPDGSDLEIFATGFRNPYDLTFSPTGELFTADNSPDHLNTSFNWLPPEELNFVHEGGHYGFPYVYGRARRDVDDYLDPVAELPTSSASSGLVYYSAEKFPPEYHGVFVALFGSGTNSESIIGMNTGRMVVFVPITVGEGGEYVSEWQFFAQFRTEYNAYHPIDVTVGADGSLYIAEWTTATVYRVDYDATLLAASVAAEHVQPEIVLLGEDIFINGRNSLPACVTCHVLSETDMSIGTRLSQIREEAPTRIEGMSAAEYIYESIIEPNAYVVEGYQPSLMYQEYGTGLTSEEIDALVAYILASN